MNSKLVYSVLGGGLGLILIGGLVNIQPSPDVQQGIQNNNVRSLDQIDVDSWRDIIGNIQKYNPAVETPTETLLEVESVDNAPLVAIADGQLLGVVLNDEPRAILLLPESEEPIILKVGDSWLEPWALTKIQNNSVEWSRSDNDESFVQPLFQ